MSAANRSAGVDYCIVHHGIRNEDAYVCDTAFDDLDAMRYGGADFEPTEDGEPRPCVLRECFYTTRRPKRPRRPVEDRPYIEMVGRMIKAAGRRVANADPDTLGVFLTLKELVDDVAAEAMIALNSGDRATRYSWADIAAAARSDASTVSKWAKARAEKLRGESTHIKSAESRPAA